MRIQSNISAINTQRQMFRVNNAQSKALEKLSSGFRINRAADDAAGLAISEKMRSQIRGMRQASRNAQDGISVVQTAEGALDEVHGMLQRMKELAVQSANDSNQSLVDREAIQLEVDALTEEINSITEKTQFNKMNLLDGSFEGKKFHVGANANQTIGISIKSMTAQGLGLKVGGTEELENIAAGSREFTVKGYRVVTAGAGNISKTDEIALADVAITGGNPQNKKAVFQFDVNGKTGTFEVDWTPDPAGGTAHKFKKEDIAKAAAEAINAAAPNLGAKATGEKLTFDKGVEAQGYVGAYAKIALLNESDFHIEQAPTDFSWGLSMADATFGDEKEAVVQISHEVGVGNMEISLDGDTPKIVRLTKEDDTKDKIAAKVKAVFGDALTVQKWEKPAGGAQGVLTLKSASKGERASISVRYSGAAGMKKVDYKGVNVLTRESANASMSNVQDAIETLASRRAELGAIQNRIEHTISNLDNSHENLKAAEARVRDTDMAEMIIESARTSILSQAAISMLSQANQVPQNVLSLLR